MDLNNSIDRIRCDCTDMTVGRLIDQCRHHRRHRRHPGGPSSSDGVVLIDSAPSLHKDRRQSGRVVDPSIGDFYIFPGPEIEMKDKQRRRLAAVK